VAVHEAFQDAADRLAATRDTYLRTRAEDVREVSQLILSSLMRGEEAFVPAIPAHDEVVFVSRHLHVSGVLRAHRAGARAFVTSSRAFSSHAAILLRASGIPSVGGVDIDGLPAGAPVMVDGLRAEITLHPNEMAHTRAREVGAEAESRRANRALPPEPAVTADGCEVKLWANIDTPEQIGLCGDFRLHGIGLFRTEFLVLSSGRPPTENDQMKVYQAMVEQVQGRPVVIRTFDIGADKVADGLADDRGDNPALGLRGLRRHLWRRPTELRAQLRAILRATRGHEAAVLFPMVTHVGDVITAREHLDAVRTELNANRVPYNRDLRVAAMVETPAAALSVVDILETVDFVSIGTNDLSQYLGAADRNDASVAQYLAPEASGLFTALEWMIEEAREVGRSADINVCGEVTSDPEVAARMVELGYTSLTVVPMASPPVRAAIGAVRCSTE
jgi:phosphotransferase system enzyme I (PtsI)